MEYTTKEISFNGEESIEAIKHQIANNLMQVHNLFSDLQLKSPEEVYGFLCFENVRKDEKERFKKFAWLGERLRELAYEEEVLPLQIVFAHYQALEEDLKEEIKKIETI